jgi:hypothetical protein
VGGIVTTTAIARAALLALGLAAAPVAAQDRPGEEELFGAPAPKPIPPATPSRPAESDILAAPAATLQLREDSLKIGGMLYLRANANWSKGVPPSEWTLDSPNLMDLYLDVRPNDRVRAFALARMLYDPAVDPSTPNPLGGAVKVTDVFLDQLWIRFDVERIAFVTAGKQHVKWGTGYFWNPTDYLHKTPRNPLAVFDDRAGTMLLKLHLPWERKGWNFYAVGILESDEPVNRVGKVGAAARAEVVLGTVEIGADAVVRKGKSPLFGVDFSAGIWEVDVYGEASLHTGSRIPLWTMAAPPDFSAVPPLLGSYQPYEPGFNPQATIGARWSWKYSDEDSLTIGAEWYFNEAGYDDPRIYPWLFYTGDLQPFYQGRQYAGVYVLLPKPGSWNNTDFVLSTVGNLADRSFVTRLDWSWVALTYLRVEAFAAVHYGTEGGEFRFSLDVPRVTIPGSNPPATIGPYLYPPPVLDLGLALRVNL